VPAKFIFKTRIFGRRFYKITTDRNNFINGILDFLQPRFSLLISVLQCFPSLTDAFVSIGHANTPMPKPYEVLKSLIRRCTVRTNFHIFDPSQMNYPPISGMNNIVTRSTNVLQPLKKLNRLAIPHTVTPSRNNTYRIWFQKYGTDHRVANGGYFNGLPRGVLHAQFQKQIPKTHICLSKLMSMQ